MYAGDLAIIGAGAMGSAIAQGLVKAKAVDKKHVCVCDHGKAKLDRLAKDLDCHLCLEAKDAVTADTQVVILAVKPQVILDLCHRLDEALVGKLVISIAAGVTISQLEQVLPESRIIRVMPNLPISCQMGASSIAAGTSATAEDVRLVSQLFDALGVTGVLSESQLDIEASVVGCAPAFFALLVDGLTRAGILQGVPAATTRQMLIETMEGTAQILKETQEHPRAFMDKVTSPGGTTAAALVAMEPSVMQGCLEGIQAAMDRTEELKSREEAYEDLIVFLDP